MEAAVLCILAARAALGLVARLPILDQQQQQQQDNDAVVSTVRQVVSRATVLCAAANDCALRIVEAPALAARSPLCRRAVHTARACRQELAQRLGEIGCVASTALHPAVGVVRSRALHGLGIAVLPTSTMVPRRRPMIRAGEVLVRESQPLFLLRNSEADAQTFAESLFETTTPQAARTLGCFLTLTSGSSSMPTSTAPSRRDDAASVFSSNVMRMTRPDFAIDADNDAHSAPRGVYLLSSRFNHRCHLPTAMAFYDHSSGGIEVVALRDLDTLGEEICIAYCAPWDAPAEKARKLGFACTCALCASGSLLLVTMPTSPVDVAALAAEADRCVAAASELLQRSEGDRALHVMMHFYGARIHPSLGPFHHLRLSFATELLAAAVAASVGSVRQVELLMQVVETMRSAAQALLPEHFPLCAAFDMHACFLLGLRTRLLHRALAVKGDDSSEFSAEWWRDNDAASFGRAQTLVVKAQRSHLTTRPLESFEARFANELSACNFV